MFQTINALSNTVQGWATNMDKANIQHAKMKAVDYNSELKAKIAQASIKDSQSLSTIEDLSDDKITSNQAKWDKLTSIYFPAT